MIWVKSTAMKPNHNKTAKTPTVGLPVFSGVLYVSIFHFYLAKKTGERSSSSYLGLWFKTKMSSCQYKKSHCGDKTIVRSSYFHNGSSYTCNTVSAKTPTVGLPVFSGVLYVSKLHFYLAKKNGGKILFFISRALIQNKDVVLPV